MTTIWQRIVFEFQALVPPPPCLRRCRECWEYIGHKPKRYRWCQRCWIAVEHPRRCMERVYTHRAAQARVRKALRGGR